MKCGGDTEFLAHLDRFVDDLYLIAERTKNDITWRGSITQDDATNTGILLHVITHGKVSLPIDTMDLTQDVLEFEKLRPALEQGCQGLTFRHAGPPVFGKVFGHDFDLGEYQVLVQPREVQVSPAPDNPQLLNIRIIVDGEATFVFDKFRQ